MKEPLVSDVLTLTNTLSIPLPLSRVLCCRGLDTPSAAQSFFNTDAASFLSPFAMKNMDIAVSILLAALEQKESMVVFGDYDVDGVSATSVLYLYLASLGANVSYYIPSRHHEGYGLSLSAIRSFLDQDVNLLITTDSGVTANDEIAFAKAGGMNVIVTDHHTCYAEMPPADAVVNPMQCDCNYPFKGLAGVGVVFKLITALEMMIQNLDTAHASAAIMERYGDLVAIGTVGDVMPLLGENRTIVTWGLSTLERTHNVGLAALMKQIAVESSGSSARKLNTTYISYTLAPRINAVGRIADATLAVELFTTADAERAEDIALELCNINTRRKTLENTIFDEALRQINDDIDLDHTSFLVLADDNWHHGIIGIVASRIAERFHRSCILISFRNESDGSVSDIGKGSGRSVDDLNLVDALHAASDILVKFGGHKSAAGLTVEKKHLSSLRAHLNAYALEGMTEDNGATLLLDTYLLPDEINMNFVLALQKLQPYGQDNNQPVFYLKDYFITSIFSLSGGKHTRFHLALPGNSVLPVLCFGYPYGDFMFNKGDRVDVAGTLDINIYQNKETLQLSLVDMRLSDEFICEQTGEFTLIHNICQNEIPDPPLTDVPLDHELPPIYLYIKQVVTTSGAEIRLSPGSAAADISREYEITCSRLKLLLALHIFEECGLLVMSCSSCDLPISLRLLPRRNQKVSLTESPLYLRLRTYYKTRTK